MIWTSRQPFPRLSLTYAAILISLLPAEAKAAAEIKISVDSPAAHFSPGNWAGDTGREGSGYRVTWNSGAYCSFFWSTESTTPTAILEISNKTPWARVSYFIDGKKVDQVEVPASGGIPIQKLAGSGHHELVVYMASSPQEKRWDRTNAITVKGLTVDGQSTPQVAPAERPWVAIIGDSITEGIGVPSNLEDYSFLLGQELLKRGFDYSVSACGYSGWIRPGDSTGDVPGYYPITNSTEGSGGSYKQTASRWDKIDSTTSLLDRNGHISGWGGTGQEPSAIMINYMVNETVCNANLSDCQASVTQCLTALRQAAPHTLICVIVPPGLHNTSLYPQGAAYITALKAGLNAYKQAQPQDKLIVEIDLGSAVADNLASPVNGGGFHYNAAGHAYVAPLLWQALSSHLQFSSGEM